LTIGFFASFTSVGTFGTETISNKNFFYKQLVLVTTLVSTRVSFFFNENTFDDIIFCGRAGTHCPFVPVG
jgi:hypothetical protein